MAQPVTELNDIQGIVRSGYGSLEDAVFLLLRVVDAAKAKAWLGAVAGGSASPSYRVTSAGDLTTRQEQALQIAFTAPGLNSLGLAEDLTHEFSREFYGGLATEAAIAEGRSRRLGDLGANAPAHWLWGAGPDVPDAVVLLYAMKGALSPLLAQVKADIAAGFAIMHEFPTTNKALGNGDRLEHFGFIDGISQPAIDWKAARNPGDADVLEYGNLISAGEFLLGYTNEYGLYEQRPLLAPEQDPDRILAPAGDAPGMRDFARNGTFLVFRQLDQDVAGFWRFASAKDPKSQGAALAEAMVGRKLGTGDPLVTKATAGIQGVGPDPRDIRGNGFTFYSDPEGLSCPIGAHIRRANPRTADMPGGKQGLISRLLRMLGFKHGPPREDIVSSSRFHRILRRGRSYGAFVEPTQAGSSPAGLHFICLNANLSRQFEFIQNAWLVNPTFDGLSGESDPLLGNRLDFPPGHPTDNFTLPQATGQCRRISSLPQFITVRGGAYFFLPSMRALRYLAQAGK